MRTNMIKKRLIPVMFLALLLLVAGCGEKTAGGPTEVNSLRVEEQLLEDDKNWLDDKIIIIEDTADSESVGTDMPLDNKGMISNNGSTNVNTDSNRDKKDDKPDLTETTPMLPGSILLSIKEITITDYEKKFGRNHFISDPIIAVAARIARVTINNVLINGKIGVGDRLTLKGFDGDVYQIVVDNVWTYQDSFTFSGVIEGFINCNIMFSVADNKVLAVMKLHEANTVYLIKYNHLSSEHYIYKAPIDKVEVIEEDIVLIPPNQ